MTIFRPDREIPANPSAPCGMAQVHYAEEAIIINDFTGLYCIMATNGESARQWLESNKHKVSEQRIIQIRDSLQKKFETLTGADEPADPNEEQGLVEALDVMDAFIESRYGERPPEDSSAELDYSSLIDSSGCQAPVLDGPEKQRRFQELLKKSKF